MGRRKKEPENTHRENIAFAAKKLFIQKGTIFTTMDDIAKEAGYSKATLYVYFKNKEELIRFLVFKSMKFLHNTICNALSKHIETKAKYNAICNALVQYQEQFPFYFEFTINEINVDFEKSEYLPVDKKTYEIGEQINQEISQLLVTGMSRGEIRKDILIKPTVFIFWGTLCGLIQMADKKQDYINKAMNMSKQAFLEYGFNTLYQSITRMEEMKQ